MEDNSLGGFKKTDLAISGGHVGQTSKIINEKLWYLLKSKGTLWKPKLSKLFREFLGHNLYVFFGIPIPEMQLISFEENNQRNYCLFFEQIPDSRQIGSEMTPALIHSLIPLLAVITVLGDNDGLGRSGDNALINAQGKVYKIDCGDTFQMLDPRVFLRARHSNPPFNDCINFIAQNPAYLKEFIGYLQAMGANSLSLEKFISEIAKTYQVLTAPHQETFASFGNTMLGSPTLVAQKILDNIKLSIQICVAKLNSLTQQPAIPTFPQTPQQMNIPAQTLVYSQNLSPRQALPQTTNYSSVNNSIPFYKLPFPPSALPKSRGDSFTPPPPSQNNERNRRYTYPPGSQPPQANQYRKY